MINQKENHTLPNTNLPNIKLHSRNHLIVIILAVATAAVAMANPSPVPSATVVVSRIDRILIASEWTSPEILYPAGRVDFRQAKFVLTDGVRKLTNTPEDRNPWRNIASPNDRVGIMLDLDTPPASIETVNAIIDGLVSSGVSQDNIIVFAADEAQLFRAGIALNPTGRGVRTMGAESEGFREGLSRIIRDYSDVIINVARLRADEKLGMKGCVANNLTLVPLVDQLRLLKDEASLPEPAANPLVRHKTSLCVLEAYQPILRDTDEDFPPMWEYRGLILSTDPVAADVVGLQILQAKYDATEGSSDWEGAKPSHALKYLNRAGSDDYRAGQCDPDKITIQTIGDAADRLIEPTD